MIHTLTEENHAAWLTRFSDFHDHVIRHVAISLLSAPTFEKVGLIETSGLDSKDDPSGKWVNVRFRLHKLLGFRVDNITGVVFTLGVVFSEGKVYLDFDAYGQQKSVDEILQSEFFFCGTRCTLEILPYSETPPAV